MLPVAKSENKEVKSGGFNLSTLRWKDLGTYLLPGCNNIAGVGNCGIVSRMAVRHRSGVKMK